MVIQNLTGMRDIRNQAKHETTECHQRDATVVVVVEDTPLIGIEEEMIERVCHRYLDLYYIVYQIQSYYEMLFHNSKNSKRVLYIFL